MEFIQVLTANTGRQIEMYQNGALTFAGECGFRLIKEFHVAPVNRALLCRFGADDNRETVLKPLNAESHPRVAFCAECARST